MRTWVKLGGRISMDRARGYRFRMASKQSTVDFIVEQAAAAGGVAARKMFGEYAVYRAGKLVGLICDDQLFIKPTPGGRAFLGGDATEAAPYPGAKPCFLIPGEAWDDAARLAELVTITAAELPAPRKTPGKSRRAATRTPRG